MKTTTEILGYSVQGYDEVLKASFVTGLESSESKARKTLEGMLYGGAYSESEKNNLKVVRISRVIEEI